MAVPATLLYGGILIIVKTLLAANVTRHRAQKETFYGHGGDEDLERAVRAHGNTAEYLPMGLIMLAACELSGGSETIVHALGGAFTVARLLTPFGLISRIDAGRIGGAVLTWAVMLAMGGYALFLRFGA